MTCWCSLALTQLFAAGIPLLVWAVKKRRLKPVAQVMLEQWAISVVDRHASMTYKLGQVEQIYS